jgi:hypothetical protein
MSDFKPSADSYWVEPGRLLAGEHPGHWDQAVARRRLASLLDAGIRLFIDLCEPDEPVQPYKAQLDRLCRDRCISVDYISQPLPERGVPDHAEDVACLLRAVRSVVERGERAYIHCSDGVGRTGMVVGCWLVERGYDPEDALDELARRFATMSRAAISRNPPQNCVQAEWVENWAPMLGLAGARSQAC